MNPRERIPFIHEAQREKIARVWSPSRKEVADAISWGVPPFRKVMIEEPIRNPESAIKALKEGKLMLESDLRRPFSKPALAAASLRNIGLQLERAATLNLQNGMILPFVLFHDLKAGILGVAYAIDTAQEVTKRGVHDVVLKSELGFENGISRVGIDIPLNQWVEGHLRSTVDFADTASFLKEDPTGFLLVEEAAKRLKGWENRFRTQARFLHKPVPEFVAIGADLAEQSYKINYNLLERVY